MAQTIPVTQARENFAEIINKVLYLGEEFVIKKQGKPVVLITGVKRDPEQRDKRLNTREFLHKLADYKMKKGPRDLAKKHDKYTWE